MPIETVKSILSVVLIVIALVQMLIMFELFGRENPRYAAATLKRVHRINGIVFLSLYLFIAYFCLEYIVSTKTEPTARVAFHAVFALFVLMLLLLKIAFVRFYRPFYEKALTIGPLIALLTFAMMATAGGYYLLVTLF